MADKLTFDGWPDEKQKDEKPPNRLMPFHRIRVPVNRIIEPGGPAPEQRRRKVISGDGYGVGARSTKDYDAQFGEDLGRELADLVENIFPPLRVLGLISRGISSALAALIRLIPGGEPLANSIDDFDPLVRLFEFIGSNVDALLVDSFIRAIPAWVPVQDPAQFPNNQFLEVDGILVRSFQKFDSIPFWQWHRWYDWHFAIGVSPVFQQVVGFGNLHRDKDNTMGEPDGVNLQNYHKDNLPKGGGESAFSIADCEWDIGAIGLRSGPVRPGPDNEDRIPVFFDQLRPRVKHDWCWPQAGMFFWAMGRSVYECTHATKDVGRRKRPPQQIGAPLSEEERVRRGVHINQINPPKAIATARWEAFQFKENPKPVPAIQFMFYANTHLSSAAFFDKDNPHRSGFPPLNTDDFEFIVDLPDPVVTAKSEYPVGHTPEFALNTLVLQPRLVVNADFEPFQKDGAGGPADGVVEDSDDRTSNELTTARGPEPIVELFGAKPNEPPRQALVRIPLKNNISENINSYGVLLSIGWLDPDAVSAPRVKKVTVTLVAIEPFQPDSDADWNLNVGVNGRWCVFRFNAAKATRTPTGALRVDLASISGGTVEFQMLLAEEDMILVSSHGFEEDPFDGIMRLKPEFPIPEKRPPKAAPQLTPPGQPLPTPEDIARFKAETLQRTKVFGDRILRDAASMTVPTGPPSTSGVPTENISIPMVGRELEWQTDIDVDDDSRASLTARAMFLRMAIGNRFDANDVIGMIDPNMRDPFSLDPFVRRLEDGTDSENPITVKDVIKAVGIGGTRNCRVSAYKSEVVGRMGAMGYNPNVVEYTLFFDVKVEDLPESR